MLAPFLVTSDATMKKAPFFAALLLATSSGTHAVDWDSIKDKASELGNTAIDVSKDAWDATSEWSVEAWESSSEWAAHALDQAGDWSEDALEKGKEWAAVGEKKLETMLEPESPAEARKALDTMADVTLVKLFSEHPIAKPLFDSAYGYAVFDSRKFSLVLHTNGGSGVAINRKAGKHIYMNMFGAGLAVGIGGKFYQQVMLFQNKDSFEQFVNDGWDKGWEGSSEVSAVAWDESVELSTKYNGGLAIFVLNDKGLLLDANITGSKYWRDSDLN